MAEALNHKTNASAKQYPKSRILPNVIDNTAKEDPSKEAFFIPRSADPKDGWKAITFKQYANAINWLAHRIVEACGTPTPGSFPTIAYIGPNDARYIVILVAAVKAGYKALFISPRNSHEGQMSLFDKTDCRILAFAKPQRGLIQPWLQERDMKAIEVGEMESWFPEQDVEPFPYEKTIEEAEWDPLMVLHTSGSTGIPKPIIVRQGMIATNDEYRHHPKFHGAVSWLQGFSERGPRHLMPMPLFHAAGMYVFIFCSIYYNAPVALAIGERPLSVDLVLDYLKYAGVQGAILPPALIEEMSYDEECIQALAKLNVVCFGGGNLNKDAGDRLTKNGVTIAPFPLYYQPNPELWQYFIFNSELLGADWRKVDGTEDVYRMVIVRKDKHPGLQGIFYTFPDIDEYDTKDMYRPHPTLPDHWIYYGRSDNIIVFSNGEKLNPVTIEDIVGSHPEVKGAMVVGSNRFQAGLLIEPTTTPENKEEAQKLLDRIWPYVQDANRETVAHGQIGREFVMLSDPKKPFPRAGKGTIQRAGALKLYKEEIDKLYEGAEALFDNSPPAMDVSSEESLIESIKDVFSSRLGFKGELGPDTDFFTVGIDSLLVINAARLIRSGLEASGVHADATLLANRVIYGNPTPKRLARYIFSIVNGGAHTTPENKAEIEVETMKSLWKKYTDNLHTKKQDRPDPVVEGQTVLLTGSTGMLGSYMLDFMVRNPAVKKIICLNRAEDGGAERQAQAAKQRGLDPNFASKTEFLHADMSRPDFGIPQEVYDRLLKEADRIIHNAWPVNFNIPVESFEPHLRSVRNIADFATLSSKRVAVVFISSIGTVEQWDGSNGKVPEARIEDFKYAGGGYGRSKMIGSLILEDAAKVGDFPAAIIRVGQIAGPEAEAGNWNKQEWLPSIIASSLYLKALPSHLGIMNRVDWTPSESIAKLVLEVGGVSQEVPASEISGYYHGVNPNAVSWTELAPAVQEFYGKDRIPELLSFDEWVDRLEETSQGDQTQSLDKNPGVKLIDSYRGMANAHKAGQEPFVCDMTHTTERSPTMKAAKAITPEMMKHWCKQWGF
ncbi:hypothetical protein M426DRAFT_73780 [Hypoxylon sp. CI-4A]|nr:hypothetical protein M426DRAFT_73780 [Hypoxylon sp. CI-4A]